MNMKTQVLIGLLYLLNQNINPKIVRNRQNRLVIQSSCAICNNKKSRFIKEQKALGILSNLGIKTL